MKTLSYVIYSWVWWLSRQGGSSLPMKWSTVLSSKYTFQMVTMFLFNIQHKNAQLRSLDERWFTKAGIVWRFWFIAESHTTKNVSWKLEETVPDYFNGIVLQRHNLEMPESSFGHLKFQVAFNLAVVWMIVFVSLSKGTSLLKWPRVLTVWGIGGKPVQLGFGRRMLGGFSAELWPTRQSYLCFWDFTLN